MRQLTLPMILVGLAASPLCAQKLELRVGGAAQPARRLAAQSPQGGTANGTIGQLEVGIRAGPVRLEVHNGTGSFATDSGSIGSGTITTAGASAGIGTKGIWIGGGVGRRAYTGTIARRVWQFTEVHGGLSFNIVGPIRGEIEGGVYLSAKEIDGPTEATGRFASTSLLFEPARIPVYLVIGFRAETFNPADGSSSAPDEISGLILGGGMRLGR